MSKTTIDLKRQNQGFHLKATNEHGAELHLDAAPKIGGEDKGFRPMEMLLAAIAGCASIDLGLFLKKQRQELRDLDIRVEGTRAPGTEPPRVWTGIHLHFTLHGDLKVNRVERALELAVKKYCSVAEMLKRDAEITYSYEIVE